jgi:transcription initiation factor IIE alpha subunit
MSVKDKRFYRVCPICGDILPGTDDGLEVFQSLEEQIANPEEGSKFGCTLCGERVTQEEADEIIKNGEPELKKA